MLVSTREQNQKNYKKNNYFIKRIPSIETKVGLNLQKCFNSVNKGDLFKNSICFETAHTQNFALRKTGFTRIKKVTFFLCTQQKKSFSSNNSFLCAMVKP